MYFYVHPSKFAFDLYVLLYDFPNIIIIIIISALSEVQDCIFCFSVKVPSLLADIYYVYSLDFYIYF